MSSTTLTRPANNPDHKYEVKKKNLDAVARVTGVPWEPFAGGETLPEAEILGPHETPPAGHSMVNVYDVQAAAGDGAVIDEYEAIASRLSFPPNYLRHITTTDPNHLAIISVTGGSMLPILNHDDIVMVDMTKKNIAYDGMFVVRHDGLLKVKRLQWGPKKETIVLHSENSTLHPPDEIPVGDLDIIGRVVWIGAKQP